MQIVIDIPNSTFTDLKKKQNRTEVDVAVLNGIPQLEKIHVANIHFDEEKFEKIMKNAPLTILDDSNTPTIQLIQPKTGHWIKISPQGIYECSECGQNVMTGDICAYKFCNGCGARMVESQESEDT